MERLHSLSQWASGLGVSRATLRGWLVQAGVFLPDVVRGSKYLIPKADIDRAVRGRMPQTNLPRLRLMRSQRMAKVG